MPYTIRPLGCDPARIKGMSEKLIVSHYAAHQSMGDGPLDHARRRDADPGARYVRALLHMDYGAKAATYVETYMAAIRWSNFDRLFAGVAR